MKIPSVAAVRALQRTSVVRLVDQCILFMLNEIHSYVVTIPGAPYMEDRTGGTAHQRFALGAAQACCGKAEFETVIGTIVWPLVSHLPFSF